MFHAENEARYAHGYPFTAWFQLGLLYFMGIYTAREQGLISRTTLFTKFWRFHYFDSIGFAQRGVKYAWLGGLVAGTFLFGNPQIAYQRCVSKINFYLFEGKLDYNASLTNNGESSS